MQKPLFPVDAADVEDDAFDAAPSRPFTGAVALKDASGPLPSVQNVAPPPLASVGDQIGIAADTAALVPFTDFAAAALGETNSGYFADEPSPPAPALRTIQNSGASANRVDMVFLGDGYTAGEISTTYNNHVNAYVNYIFGGTALTDPFSRYRNFFNIHVVDVVSNESGADDPSAGIVRDTALGASYRWDGVTQRLLYVTNSLADAQMSSALAGTGIVDEMRYVTVNSSQYGGGGGKYAVYAGGNSSALEVALHEVGHSFAGLADEYGGTTSPYAGAEPTEINVSKNSSGAKWAEWLGYVDPTLGTVGAYNGGRYYDSGIYRPTDNSKMRSVRRDRARGVHPQVLRAREPA
jgi:IgA Peptidase M64